MIIIPVRPNNPIDGAPWLSHVRVTEGSGSYTLTSKPTILYNKSNEIQPQVTIEIDSFEVAPGATQTVNLKMGNTTDNALQNALLVLDVPDGYTLSSATGKYIASEGQIVWPIGNLSAAQWTQQSAVLQLSNGLTNNTVLKLEASLKNQTEIVARASSSSIVKTTPSVIFQVSSSYSQPLIASSVISSSISVTNTGGTQLADVFLSTKVPSWTRATPLDSATGCSSNCFDYQWATWALGNVNAASSVSRSINPVVQNDALPGQILFANFYLSHSSSPSRDSVLNRTWGIGTAFSVNSNHDSDGDQIPDWWELQYASVMDRLDGSDGAKDPDLDGYSNLEEYQLSIQENPEFAYSPLLPDPKDTDQDGLFDRIELALGTNVNSADTDNDGISDLIDNDPTVPYSEKQGVRQVLQLQDINSDGTDDIGLFALVDEKPSLIVINGKTQTTLTTYTWNNVDYIDMQVILIPDTNENGFNEVGLFGIRNSGAGLGRPQVSIRDTENGELLQRVNWVDNWLNVKPMVLDDLDEDGVPEIAIQGRFKTYNGGARPQLIVRSGRTGQAGDTFGYPSLFTDPEYYQFSDTNNDGVGEIATFGRIARNGKIQIKIADGKDPNDRQKAYNFPDKWTDISWLRLSDMNNDGVDDWGLFGTRRDDNRPQLIVKDGTDPKGAIRIYAWASDIVTPSFFIVPDMNFDNISEVAVGGIRTNGRYQFQVKDGADRNVVLANHNVNSPLNDVNFIVLPDVNNDGSAEIGMFGKDDNDQYIVVVRQGNLADLAPSLHEITSVNLGSDWATKPNTMIVNDIDGDGIQDLMVWGNSMQGADKQAFVMSSDMR